MTSQTYIEATPQNLALALALAYEPPTKTETIDCLKQIARTLLGVSRLPSGFGETVAAALVEYDTLRHDRANWHRSIEREERRREKAAYDASLEGRVDNRFRAHETLKNAASRWVDVETSLVTSLVTRGEEIVIDVQTAEVWHKKHPWKGTSVFYHARLTPNYLSIPKRILVVDGVMTLAALPIPRNDGMEAWFCVFARHGRGYSVSVSTGYLAGRDDLYVHGETLEVAVRAYHRRSPEGQEAAEKRAEKRSARNAAKAAARAATKAALWQQIEAGSDPCMMAYSDARAADLCEIGIANWVGSVMGLDIEALDLDDLEVSPSNILQIAIATRRAISLVRRAIDRAIERHLDTLRF